MGEWAVACTVKLRRPHVVPAGYQRNFIDNGTKHILTVHKKTLRAARVGVRDNFVASHFLRVIVNDVASDDAEDEFARIESLALPLIRPLQPFEALSGEQDAAVKATMAMLWSRSFSREIVARRVHDQVLADLRSRMSVDRRARAMFAMDVGRQPKPGELERLVDEQADKMLRERLHDVESMQQYYNRALTKFARYHVALYRPAPRHEFVTSDNPVLLARSNHLIQVGSQNGLALGDASFIFLPISRQVGACLTTELEGDLDLDSATTIRINQATWRNAVERIACHPSAEWWRLCNVRSTTPS